jgi:hypothetical protein
MKYNKEKLQRMLYIQLENLDVYAEKIDILKKQNELLKKENQLLEKKVLDPGKKLKPYRKRK